MTPPRHRLDALTAALGTPTPAPTPPVGPRGAIPLASPTAPAREAYGSPMASPTACARGEVLGMPPGMLAALPVACALALRSASGGELWATTGRATAAALRGVGIPTLSGRELGVLALGAENGRQSREAFACWLRDGGGLRPHPPIERAAYGGVYALETPNQRWPLARVLAAWGLTLTAVCVGDGPEMECLECLM